MEQYQSRNTFLVSRAFKGYVLASVLTSAAIQTASTFDAVILAQCVGAEAVSASSIIMPVEIAFSCVGLLLAYGANAMVARALGRHDREEASAVFSTTIASILIVGGFFCLLMYSFCPAIARFLTDDETLYTLTYDYLSVYTLGAWLDMLATAFCLFVATDGQPKFATQAAIIGVVVNIVSDIVTIGMLGWGVKGSAVGFLLQYAVCVVLLGFYFRSPKCSYSLRLPGRRLWQMMSQNMKEGLAVFINNILIAASIFIINVISYNALGEGGLFCWSVCLQVLMVAAVAINAIMEGLMAIGGVMVGEHDQRGLGILAKKSLPAICTLMLLLIVPMWIPDSCATLFGADDPSMMDEVNRVLRIFSLMLIPFSLTLVLAAIYQVLELAKLNVVVTVGQLVVMVLTLWLLSVYAPDYFWWGFPLSAFLFVVVQFVNSYIAYLKTHGALSPLTLVPYSTGGRSLDCSVRYQSDDVFSVLHQLDDFLKQSGINPSSIFKLNLCCEELMTNISNHSTGRVTHHSFDLYAYVDDGTAYVTLKDAGRPFNPLLAGKMADSHIGQEGYQHLGLRLVNSIIDDISYQYMYGLNVVFLKV